MKTQGILKTLPMTALIAAFAFTACGTGPDADTVDKKVDNEIAELNKELKSIEDLDKIRTELTEDLRELREKISEHIQEMDEKLAKKDLSAEKRAEIEAKRTSYNEQIARINAATNRISMATKEAWGDVERTTRNEVNELDSWWESQKEKIDQKTDADKDHDGH